MGCGRGPWWPPQRGLLSPVAFIEEAERTGLLVGMSDLVMTRAAHRRGPIAEQFPTLYFSFNLTPLELALPQRPNRLATDGAWRSMPSERDTAVSPNGSAKRSIDSRSTARWSPPSPTRP